MAFSSFLNPSVTVFRFFDFFSIVCVLSWNKRGVRPEVILVRHLYIDVRELSLSAKSLKSDTNRKQSDLVLKDLGTLFLYHTKVPGLYRKIPLGIA